MGILDRLVSGFFKSADKDFYNRGSILGFIQMCESYYKDISNKFPNKDPHEQLVGVYNLIQVKSGAMKEADLYNPAKSWEALLRTLKAACLPSPLCARALAYILISIDQNLLVEFLTNEEFKSYKEEYDKYLSPLFKADENYIKDLYCKYNKNKENQDLLFK